MSLLRPAALTTGHKVMRTECTPNRRRSESIGGDIMEISLSHKTLQYSPSDACFCLTVRIPSIWNDDPGAAGTARQTRRGPVSWRILMLSILLMLEVMGATRLLRTTGRTAYWRPSNGLLMGFRCGDDPSHSYTASCPQENVRKCRDEIWLGAAARCLDGIQQRSFAATLDRGKRSRGGPAGMATVGERMMSRARTRGGRRDYLRGVRIQIDRSSRGRSASAGHAHR